VLTGVLGFRYFAIHQVAASERAPSPLKLRNIACCVCLHAVYCFIAVL